MNVQAAAEAQPDSLKRSWQALLDSIRRSSSAVAGSSTVALHTSFGGVALILSVQKRAEASYQFIEIQPDIESEHGGHLANIDELPSLSKKRGFHLQFVVHTRDGSTTTGTIKSAKTAKDLLRNLLQTFVSLIPKQAHAAAEAPATAHAGNAFIYAWTTDRISGSEFSRKLLYEAEKEVHARVPGTSVTHHAVSFNDDHRPGMLRRTISVSSNDIKTAVALVIRHLLAAEWCVGFGTTYRFVEKTKENAAQVFKYTMERKTTLFAQAAAEPPSLSKEHLLKKFRAISIDPEKLTPVQGQPGVYDYDGDVHWNHLKLKKFPIRLRNVRGDFYCDHNHELTSLEGAPVKVNSFDCSHCGLTSLRHAPKKVYGNFDGSYNRLAALDCAETQVSGDFNVRNNNLTSLDGAPAEVRCDFNCEHNHLPESTEKPDSVRGFFNCEGQRPAAAQAAAEPETEANKDQLRRRVSMINLELKKLKPVPGRPGVFDYNGDVDWSRMNLVKFPLRLRNVRGSFECDGNQLSSLHGGPERVSRAFSCCVNLLKTLNGAPAYVGGAFYCEGNHLTSLEGAPATVRGGFYCSYNRLPVGTSKPKGVRGIFGCSAQSPQDTDQAQAAAEAEPFVSWRDLVTPWIRKGSAPLKLSVHGRDFYVKPDRVFGFSVFVRSGAAHISDPYMYVSVDTDSGFAVLHSTQRDIGQRCNFKMPSLERGKGILGNIVEILKCIRHPDSQEPALEFLTRSHNRVHRKGVLAAAEPEPKKQMMMMMPMQALDDMRNEIRRNPDRKFNVGNYEIWFIVGNMFPITLNVRSSAWDPSFHYADFIPGSVRSPRGTYPKLRRTDANHPIVPGDIHVGVNSWKDLLRNMIKLACKDAEKQYKQFMRDHKAEAATEPAADREISFQQALRLLKQKIPEVHVDSPMNLKAQRKSVVLSLSQHISDEHQYTVAVQFATLPILAMKVMPLRLRDLVELITAWRKAESLATLPTEEAIDAGFKATGVDRTKTREGFVRRVLEKYTATAAAEPDPVPSANNAAESIAKALGPHAKFVPGVDVVGTAHVEVRAHGAVITVYVSTECAIVRVFDVVAAVYKISSSVVKEVVATARMLRDAIARAMSDASSADDLQDRLDEELKPLHKLRRTNLGRVKLSPTFVHHAYNRAHRLEAATEPSVDREIDIKQALRLLKPKIPEAMLISATHIQAKRKAIALGIVQHFDDKTAHSVAVDFAMLPMLTHQTAKPLRLSHIVAAIAAWRQAERLAKLPLEEAIDAAFKVSGHARYRSIEDQVRRILDTHTAEAAAEVPAFDAHDAVAQAAAESDPSVSASDTAELLFQFLRTDARIRQHRFSDSDVTVDFGRLILLITKVGEGVDEHVVLLARVFAANIYAVELRTRSDIKEAAVSLLRLRKSVEDALKAPGASFESVSEDVLDLAKTLPSNKARGQTFLKWLVLEALDLRVKAAAELQAPAHLRDITQGLSSMEEQGTRTFVLQGKKYRFIVFRQTSNAQGECVRIVPLHESDIGHASPYFEITQNKAAYAHVSLYPGASTMGRLIGHADPALASGPNAVVKLLSLLKNTRSQFVYRDKYRNALEALEELHT